MKRFIAPMLTLTLLLTMLVGCATTPREQYGQIQDGFISALVIIQAARNAGDIDDETWELVIKPAVNLGDQALDAYNVATATGETGEDSLIVLQHVLRELRPFVVAYLAKND